MGKNRAAGNGLLHIIVRGSGRETGETALSQFHGYMRPNKGPLIDDRQSVGLNAVCRTLV